MGSQNPEEPFLKAGPAGTVRPEMDSGRGGTGHGSFSACAFDPKVSAIQTRFRESILTVNLISMMITHDVKPLESRMKSAEGYYRPRDIDDGLGQDGGPAVGESADPKPAEQKA